MPDGKLQTEVFQAVSRGVNGRLDPSLLPKEQAARLHNVVVRDGLAESRPALVGEALPADGRFQGAFAYELENELRWVVVVSGRIWTYSFASRTWTEKGGFPTADFPRAYFCQAGKYCIVQNGVYEPENWPVILDGDDVVDNLKTELIYRSQVLTVESFNWDAVTEGGELVDPPPSGNSSVYRVPIGKSMAYGQGRLFVAVERYWDNGLSSGQEAGWRTGEGLRFIVASDAENPSEPSRFLAFTENDLLAGGGALMLPVESGFITSMDFFRNASTGTGLGELFVLCRRGSAAFAVSTDRATEWGKPGFGQQLFQSSGSNSPSALVPVNSDLVYYGDGGLRTIKYSASNETASGGLASVPLSPEVSNYVAKTLEAHEPFVSMAAADNYVLFTAGGRELSDGSVAFTDVLPWDLSNFQVSGETPSRTFAGAWRGPLFHAVLKISRAVAGAVFRDSAAGPLKFAAFSGSDPAMVSVVRTGAYPFGAAFNLKRVKYADLMLDRIRTDVAVKVRWRADGGAWRKSDVRHFSPASVSVSGAATGLFRVPMEVDEPAGNLYEFAIEWTGHARMKLFVAFAVVLDAFKGGEDGLPCATVSLDPPVETLDIPEE